MEKKDIDFKPITPGLGFHPFSDGLPYAPVSRAQSKPVATPHTPKRDLSSGSAAVSAGAASFVYPPRVSVPVAKQEPQVRLPQPKVHAPKALQVEAAPTLPAFGEPTYGVIYLFKRTLAYLLDSFINISLLATGLSFALLNEEIKPELLMNPGIVLASILFFALFNWALITAQEIAFGTSVGKRFFRLTVQGSTTALFLRAFFFLPSVAFCGVGLIWSLFDRQKRCWHDVVANVQPQELARF